MEKINYLKKFILDALNDVENLKLLVQDKDELIKDLNSKIISIERNICDDILLLNQKINTTGYEICEINKELKSAVNKIERNTNIIAENVNAIKNLDTKIIKHDENIGELKWGVHSFEKNYYTNYMTNKIINEWKTIHMVFQGPEYHQYNLYEIRKIISFGLHTVDMLLTQTSLPVIKEILDSGIDINDVPKIIDGYIGYYTCLGTLLSWRHKPVHDDWVWRIPQNFIINNKEDIENKIKLFIIYGADINKECYNSMLARDVKIKDHPFMNTPDMLKFLNSLGKV